MEVAISEHERCHYQHFFRQDTVYPSWLALAPLPVAESSCSHMTLSIMNI